MQGLQSVHAVPRALHYRHRQYLFRVSSYSFSRNDATVDSTKMLNTAHFQKHRHRNTLAISLNDAYGT
jgi:hypothetical protein